MIQTSSIDLIADRIVRYVEKRGPVTKWKVMRALSLSFSLADRSLRMLRKQNRIQLIHATKNDRHFKWKR